MNFDAAFARLYGLEGGYSDHPDDPGGKTMYGVTERLARKYGYQGEMSQLPMATAKLIMCEEFWKAVKADQMPPRLRYPLFDAAVNSGPSQAIKWLQMALGVQVDGVIGGMTMGAVNSFNIETVRAHMIGRRLLFMSNLKNWDSFSEGWAKRIAFLLTKD